MWFRSLFDSMKRVSSPPPVQQARRGAPRQRPATHRLAVEALEDRCVPASLSVSDVTVMEGNASAQYAAVVVSLSEPHGNAVTVNYRTADGTASAGSDYDAVAGKLTFAKGETSKTILVPVRGDRAAEPNEHFFVQLSNAKGTKIADGQGFVTIVDDEPRISISDVIGREGHSGTMAFTFTVNLSAAYDLPVTLNYATTDGSASAGSDYAAASELLMFAPNQTSQTITVAVNGDRLFEPNETFLVSLSSPSAYAEISKAVGVGTIFDDEPRFSISDTYNSYGQTTFTITVYLFSADPEEVATVDFATADGTAIAGVDYVAAFGTLTFAPGEMTQTITVEVLDPTSAEYKYFSVHLSGASNNAFIENESAKVFWHYSYPDYGYSVYYA